MTAPVLADRVRKARRQSTCPLCRGPVKIGQQIAHMGPGCWVHSTCMISRNHHQEDDTMTTTTTDSILLHRVPADPIRTQLADALRQATYRGDDPGDGIGQAAALLGLDVDAAYARLGLKLETSDLVPTPDGPGDLGFTMQVIPDGVRACYRSQCTHGPDYTPGA